MSAQRGFISRFLPWVLVALGAVLAILGVASRTVWAPEPFWTASLQPSGDERLVVSDPGMLDLLADEVTVSVSVTDADDPTPEPEEDPDADDEEGEEGDDEDAEDETESGEEEAGPGVVISIARDVDATGWIDGSQALRLTGLQTETGLKSSQIAGKLEAPATTDSDLWHVVVSGEDEAELNWSKEPGRWSVVIASSPTKKISKISFTWPQSTATPMATPLILIGGVLILAGAALLVLPQVLDREGRGRMVQSLRSKTRLPKRAAPATDSETPDTIDTPEAVPEAEPEEVPEAVPEVEPEPDQEEVGEPEPAPEPAPEAAPVASSAQRFAPGTMTRRQIRELERARQEAARAAQSPQADGGASEAPEAGAGESDANPAAEVDHQDSINDGSDSPTIRSQQWRKTWGFLPEEQGEGETQTTAWLPKSVEDEEGRDE